MRRYRKHGSYILLLCCILFLSGCATVPFRASVEHLKDPYNRIPYKVEGSRRVINIFYATSRTVKGSVESSASFKRTMGEDVTYGSMDVSMNPSVRIGAVNPGRLKRRGVIGIQNINKLDGDAFTKALSDAVAASPHKSVMVLIFGYKDNFEATAIKAAYFAYLVDINTPVLLFDWPGDQSITPMGYHKARAMATASGSQLGEVLKKVINDVKPEKIWIEASSLGSQVLCDAFDHMYKDPSLADAATEIDHIVLAAPDVGADDFDEHFKQQLASLSRKLTTYVSSDDDALLISGWLDGQKKLGRRSLKVQEQLEEAKDMLYLKSLDPDRITVIDVTPINKASFRHGYYLESPEYYDDFYMRVFDKDANVNRRLYLVQAEGGTDYWVLCSGK